MSLSVSDTGIAQWRDWEGWAGPRARRGRAERSETVAARQRRMNMAGRGRGGGSGYQWGDGYDSYKYAYDYGHDSAGSYNFVSDSWMTTYPTSSNDGAKHMGPGRDSSASYLRMDRGRYGFSKPERAFGNQRPQQPALPPQVPQWRGDARGGFRDNFRPPAAIRGPERPMPFINKAAFPEAGGFQSLRAFTGNSYFGGGFKHKSRKNRKGKKPPTDEKGPPEKKTKPSTEEDGTKSKSEESESEGDGDGEAAATGTKTDAGEKQETEGADKGETKQKQTPTKKNPEIQRKHNRDRMVERIQYVCNLCKFRTFYSEEMTSHLESEFHKEHYRFVAGKFPKQTADFLQEYILFKARKTEERREAIEDLSTMIHHIYKDQDLTQGLGMEHFVKKVEVAHCAACDVVIPMNHTALQRHLRNPQHNQNRRNMMENSKKTALSVVRTILNNKQISLKLERFIKGQNPFTDDQDEAAGSSSNAMETTTEELETTATEDSEQQGPQECSTSSGNAGMETESPELVLDKQSASEDAGEELNAVSGIDEDPQ